MKIRQQIRHEKKSLTSKKGERHTKNKMNKIIRDTTEERYGYF